MEKELETHYENLFDLYSRPGWQQLMEQVKELKDQYSLINSVNGTSSLDFRKGQVDILDWIYNHKHMHEQAWEALEQEDNYETP